MASTAKTDPEEHNREEENAPSAEDEDTGAEVAPIVKLEEVAITTGEEDEDPILDLYGIVDSFHLFFLRLCLISRFGYRSSKFLCYRKSKLYRFDKDGNQWKERGVGTVKLLKHKVTGKVRLVMRQSKTLKICANHFVLPTMSVQEHAGNDKSCVWHATDFADGELKDELFAIRFPSVDNCKTFKEIVQEVAESQGKNEENKDATAAAADLLEKKLSVSESKTDVKEQEEAKDKKESAEEKTEAEAEKKEESASSA
ncbi:hypothetical protein SLEP1_g31920 [Rubroshorea leprosula]|uniref:RanBD1 domain-containing protein n=1 Tax=Rubroshorea leprosula TaxID=152421 RepID=A0AAV5KBR9_9ROSI|nr:hypothetical protein SLEP1_g31920 [Rubroshorea leprosula]